MSDGTTTTHEPINGGNGAICAVCAMRRPVMLEGVSVPTALYTPAPWPCDAAKAEAENARLRERVAELERRVWQPATGHWLVTVGDGVTSYTCVGEIEDQDEARLRVAIQRAEGDAVTALRGLRARQTGYSLADEFRAVADAVAKHAALAQAGAVEVR